MLGRMGWRAWGVVVLAGCGPTAGETADPETLFSGQTGSPAARDCENDAQCLDAAWARAESIDPDLSVRSASCEASGCVAVFVADEGCGATPVGPFYDCALSDAEVHDAWLDELSEQCTPDGACPPPEGTGVEDAAPYCLDDAECEDPSGTAE